MVLEEMDGMDKEEKQLVRDSKSFEQYVGESKFREAYEIFRRNKEVVNFTNFWILAEAYCGFRNFKASAAEELRDYVTRYIKSWDNMFAVKKLARKMGMERL